MQLLHTDMHLCFCIGKNSIFSRRGSYGVTFLSYSSSQVVDAKYNGQGPGSRSTSVKLQEHPNDALVTMVFLELGKIKIILVP